MKTSKPALLALCEEYSPVTGGYPAQRASNAENVSIWWRHHEKGAKHLPVLLASVANLHVLQAFGAYPGYPKQPTPVAPFTNMV